MKLLTKRNIKLNQLKNIRNFIGKWFISSALIFYITIMHNINLNRFNVGLNDNECIFLLCITMTTIMSLLSLFDINKQIKYIQGYI